MSVKVLAVVLGMLALGSVQVGAQTAEEREYPVLGDFPVPFVQEGETQVVIVADEADLPTAQRLVGAFAQWTSDTIEVVSDREDYPWWETNVIVVGGPGENHLARYLNGDEDLPMPFVPIASAGEGLRYAISWRFNLWEEPGSGTLQLFMHGYSGGKRHYALLIAGVDPEGTARAAEALLAKASEMPGRAAFVTDGRIEVLVDLNVAPEVPEIWFDAPVDYAFKGGLLQVGMWPREDVFPDGMVLALIHNIYLEGEVWWGGIPGGLEEEFGGYLVEELPLHLQMNGLKGFLERLGMAEPSLPELTLESVDLENGTAAIEFRAADGGVDRLSLPTRASYRRLVLQREAGLKDFTTGEPYPYSAAITVELELTNLGLGRAIWGPRGDRFFPQGFVALALAIHIHSVAIKELE
ncbi:MAG TPA: hypothetical protein ENI38_01850 [Candidatus Acetothermia bacterium]|nr:hypothetical protein [Candidatus Acetothermia bacterium]